MEENWDGADEQESVAGEIRTPRRLGAVIGARANLLLGLTAVGIVVMVPMMPMWPSVSQP